MAASSVEPDKATSLSSNQLKTRFQKIASIANTSTQCKIFPNPDLVEKVQNNLEETLRSVNPGEDVRRSGVSAFIKLVAYARFNNELIAVNVPTVLLPHGETGNSMISQVASQERSGMVARVSTRKRDLGDSRPKFRGRVSRFS